MSSQPIPAGFRAVDWLDLTQNAIVYRIADSGQPYRVVDASARVLCKLVSPYEETVADPVLLVKNGPLVIVNVCAGRYLGLFSDLEFEVCTVDTAGVSPVVDADKRPKLADSLPAVQQQRLRELRAGWPEMYGAWEIVKAPPPPAAEVLFTVTNQLAALALVNDLLIAGLPFKVQPAHRSWTFGVSPDTRAWIQKHCTAVRGADVSVYVEPDHVS